jgi:drug/metabolite transporter (DMT)-like permease
VRKGSKTTLGWVDVGLFLTVLFWAVNFSVVKATLAHIPPLAFNTFRLVGASIVLLALAPMSSKGRPIRGDGLRILALALVGHTLYQLLFIQGIDDTTASNSALFLGMTPVAVAAIGAASGVERVGARVWAGILVTVVGAYLVMGNSDATGGSLRGDLLVIAATLCWSAYTVAGKSLLERHNPIRVTAYTLAVGTIFFLPFAVGDVARLSYAQIPWTAWAGTVFSFIFAIVLAYLFWYYGVSRVGPTRTAVYSNLTPAIALAVSWSALGERLGPLQLVGAGTILLGIYLVRRARASES